MIAAAEGGVVSTFELQASIVGSLLCSRQVGLSRRLGRLRVAGVLQGVPGLLYCLLRVRLLVLGLLQVIQSALGRNEVRLGEDHVGSQRTWIEPRQHLPGSDLLPGLGEERGYSTGGFPG